MIKNNDDEDNKSTLNHKSLKHEFIFYGCSLFVVFYSCYCFLFIQCIIRFSKNLVIGLNGSSYPENIASGPWKTAPVLSGQTKNGFIISIYCTCGVDYVKLWI